MEAASGADALHHVAVAADTVNMIVEQLVAGFVETGGHVALGDSKTYCVGKALTKRTGGDFDTGCQSVFGMAGRFAHAVAGIV